MKTIRALLASALVVAAGTGPAPAGLRPTTSSARSRSWRGSAAPPRPRSPRTARRSPSSPTSAASRRSGRSRPPAATRSSSPRSTTPVGFVEWSPDGELARVHACARRRNERAGLPRPSRRHRAQAPDGRRQGEQPPRDRGPTTARSSRSTSNRRRDGAAIDAYVYDVAAGTSRLVAREPRHRRFRRSVARREVGAPESPRQSRRQQSLSRRLASGKETLLTPHEGPATFAGRVRARTAAPSTSRPTPTATRSAFARMELVALSGGSRARSRSSRERPDAELQSFTLDDAGTTAALVWNVAGKSDLELLDLKTGKIRPRARSFPRRSPSGSTSRPTASRSPWPSPARRRRPTSGSWTSPRGSFRQVTRSPHAGVDLAKLVRPELISLQGPRRPRAVGLALPPRPPAPAPYPDRARRSTAAPRARSAPASTAQYQALLSRGIAVFAPNVRGSSGFGKQVRQPRQRRPALRRRQGHQGLRRRRRQGGRGRPQAHRHHGRLLRRLHGHGRPDRVSRPLRRRRESLRRRQLRDLLQEHRALDGGDLDDRVRRPRHRGRAPAPPLPDPQGGPRQGARRSSSTAPTTPTSPSSKPSRSSTASRSAASPSSTCSSPTRATAGARRPTAIRSAVAVTRWFEKYLKEKA